MRRLPRASSAALAALLAACTSGAQSSPPGMTNAPQSPSAATTQPSAAPSQLPRATARASVVPEPIAVELRPAFRVHIAEDGDINRVAAVGDEVWVPTGRSIVRVDTKTRKTHAIDSPVAAQAADSFGATAEAVWIGDFDRGRMYRLDRTTGVVLSDLPVPAPVTFGHAHGLIWIGSGTTKTMFTIEPAGSTATMTSFPHELVAGDSVWGAVRAGTVISVDIETREPASISIDVPRGPGDCSVKGSAQSVWLLCHENDIGARLDPETNAVMATLQVGSPVFGGVLNLERWAFFIEGRDEAGEHEGRIVRVDLRTNQIDRIFDLGPEFDPNPPAVAADALWVPIAGAGELWVLPLSDLLAE